jgi:predicted Zn-dependent protease
MKAAALAAAVLLALLNLASLVGAGYADYASRHLDRPDQPSTVAAARIAARWPPWSSSHVALKGWVAAGNGDAEEARVAYAKALRLAPGDPLLWSEYAQALGRLGQFDASLTIALTQAQRLAPASPAVRRAIAEHGLAYWARGDAAQREHWLAGMRHELLRNRGAFLALALTRGQAQTFCAGPAAQLGEDKWCRRAASVVAGGCFVLTPIEPMPCAPSR